MPRAQVLAILAAACAAACSHAWDDYDPRLGGGGGAQSGVGAGGPSSAAESGSSGEETTSITSSSSSGDGGSGGDGPPTAGSTAGSSSSGSPTDTLEVFAIEADCIDPTDPDPDACDFASAANAFTVDADADPPNDAWVAHLRFAVGPELTGKTIDAVALRLHVSQEPNSNAPDSGVVWRSAPFDRASLEAGAPALLGDAPVGASVGAVALGEEVTFSLVGVDVDGDVFLAITTTLGDGVDYMDERSSTPPALVVTYH